MSGLRWISFEECAPSDSDILIPEEFVTGSCLDTDMEKEYENSKNPIRDTRRQT